MTTVGLVMYFLAVCSGTPPLEPLPLLYVLASARWAYGADRYLDGKTDDSPESIASALLLANLILWYSDQTAYVPPEILSICCYPNFKKSLPLLKPMYVGTCWATAISVVPHLIAHVPVVEDEVVAMGLLASSVSNWADIEDVEEDARDGIRTFPVRFGAVPAKALSVGLFLGSLHKSGIIPRASRRRATPLKSLVFPRGLSSLIV